MTEFKFGVAGDGRTVTAYCLENARGAKATILDYGCVVQSLCVPNAQGGLTDVVLGYDTAAEYEKNNGCFGAAIGRFANRIGGGEFTLNGQTFHLACNDRGNHLHGGLRGFDRMIWKAEQKDGALVLSRLSPDGEENYPGNLSVRITYTLTDTNELRIDYDADTDADTIVNLTNHSYFNLDGEGSVLGHKLQVFAEQITENDAHCLPTGKLLDVAGTPLDFRHPKEIGQDIDSQDTQMRYGGGYDHNFVLSGAETLKKAAVLSGSSSGIQMTVYTTQPGVQIYSSNFLFARQGKHGSTYGRRGARSALKHRFFRMRRPLHIFRAPFSV